MENTIKTLNGKQNERIVKLEVKIENLKETFDRFIDNDFKHLNSKVNYMFILVVIGILIPIILFIIK